MLGVKDGIRARWKPEAAAKCKIRLRPHASLNATCDEGELVDTFSEVSERMQEWGWREHTGVACREKRGRRENDIQPRNSDLRSHDRSGVEKLPHDKQISAFCYRAEVCVRIRKFRKSDLAQQSLWPPPHIEIISQASGIPRNRWSQGIKFHTRTPNIILVVWRCRNGDIMPPPLRGYGHRKKGVQIPERTE
jgi:hypothetical protein